MTYGGSMARPTAAEGEGRLYGAKTAVERRAERRERLLAAGLEAFGTGGFGSASIEQLCAAAGTSTRSFYEEFATREDLLIALHDELNARALEAVVGAIAEVDPDDLAARARAGVSAYFEVMTSDRRWARIALVETVGRSAAAEEHRRTAIDRFAQLLQAEAERLAAAGVIPRRNFELTAVGLTGAINGLISIWTADGSWDSKLPRVIDEAVQMIVLVLTGER
jgi:AcrR family transcriptional regulator